MCWFWWLVFDLFNCDGWCLDLLLCSLFERCAFVLGFVFCILGMAGWFWLFSLLYLVLFYVFGFF